MMALARTIVADVCILGGFAAVLLGVFEVFPPAAWVLGGVGVFYFGWRLDD